MRALVNAAALRPGSLLPLGVRVTPSWDPMTRTLLAAQLKGLVPANKAAWATRMYQMCQ
jgi:hypothetical protein